MKKFLIAAMTLFLILSGLAIKRNRAGDEPVPILNHSSGALEPDDKLNGAMLQAEAGPPLNGLIADAASSDIDSDIAETESSLESLSESELATAPHQDSSQSLSQSTKRLILLLSRWAERDAPAAATWATEFPEGPIRNSLLEQAAIAWVHTNSAEATAWLLSLPEGEGRQTATVAAAYETAAADPMRALTLARELPAGPNRDTLLEHIVSQWANQDFAAAAEWVKMISDTDLREQLLGAAAIAASAEDAPGAATLIANALPPGETQARAAVCITQRWAQSSPSDAATWISQFPEIPARDAAVENLVALWSQTDSRAAANWANSLPDGSLRQNAVNALTNSIAR